MYVDHYFLPKYATNMLHSDMSTQPELFNYAITHFAGEEEEVRSAAAFAAGMQA